MMVKAIDRIYHEWDAALSENDVEKLLALYHPDAIIESPLIPYLMGKNDGFCKRKEELRKFIEYVAQHKPIKRKYYRHSYFTDGKTLSGNIQGCRPQVSKWILSKSWKFKMG